MLTKLLQFRVNFPIVFGGALIIILLIKLTPYLLPAKYYFNFSNLVSQESAPLIVDPPAVTAAKLCNILQQRNISTKTFSRNLECSKSYISNIDDVGPALSPEEIDKIYSIALNSDQAVRGAIASILQQAPIAPLSDAQVEQIAKKNGTVGSTFEAMVEQYGDQVNLQGLSQTIEGLYSDVLQPDKNSADNGPPDSGPAPPQLSADLIRRIDQANRNLAPMLAGAVLAQKISPIKKSTVDDIVHDVQGGRAVDDRVMSFYAGSLTSAIRDAMSNAFSNLGLTAGQTADQKVVFNEIASFSWRNYVVSILLRLTPVFLFGLLVGAVAGPAEVFSIAAAGALAAFLLSWPLVLMWDRLVQSNWSDKRPLFLALYVVYVISFFVTARSAAVLGIWLREQQLLHWPAIPLGNVGSGMRVTWREVTINVAGAIVLNGLLYAWNLFLPLTASNPQ